MKKNELDRQGKSDSSRDKNRAPEGPSNGSKGSKGGAKGVDTSKGGEVKKKQ